MATVSVPVLVLVSGAAATVKLNVLGPVTDVPLVAVIHEASERPVHAHELPVETVTEPVPPAAPIVTNDEDRVKVQVAGVGVAGPEPQPEIATTHATSSTRVRMADDPLGNNTVCSPRAACCQAVRTGRAESLRHLRQLDTEPNTKPLSRRGRHRSATLYATRLPRGYPCGSG